MRNRRWLLVAVLAAGSWGCRRQPQEPITGPADTIEFASLPGLQATHNRALRAELARLVSENATPQQLLRRTTATSTQRPPRDDLAAQLDELFSDKQRGLLLRQVDRLFPRDRFEFRPRELQAAAELRERYRQPCRDYRRLITKPGSGFRVGHVRGLTDDTSFVDVVRIGNRLAAFQAAESLDLNQPAAAIEPLAVMFRAAELLAAEQSVVLRIAGVHLRGEALRVLEAIATHPEATFGVRAQLAELVDDQLQRWPADADAWIGDRAQGLHTYELVRAGYLLSLLTYDEIRELRDDVGIERLGQLVAANIDEDQLFYLQGMRRVIDGCAQPYFQRERLFRRLERELHALRDSSSYPFVADRLLLTHVAAGQRLQALDRARCDAWSLALRIVAGGDPAPGVNPLTGHRFIVELHEQRLIVDAIDPDRGERAITLSGLVVDDGVAALNHKKTPGVTGGRRVERSRGWR